MIRMQNENVEVTPNLPASGEKILTFHMTTDCTLLEVASGHSRLPNTVQISEDRSTALGRKEGS